MDTDYQNKHYNTNQKDEGTYDDRGRDRGTNFVLRIKEQETLQTLQEHYDDDQSLRLIQPPETRIGRVGNKKVTSKCDYKY